MLAMGLFFGVSLYGQHGVSPRWGPDVELPVPIGARSVRGFLYSNMGVFSNGKRVVFLRRQDGAEGIYYTYSYDGVHWSTPEFFTPCSMVKGLHAFKAVTDAMDRLHCVWTAKLPNALYYTRMDSSLHIVMDTVRIADHPEYGLFSDMYITTDLSGRIHLMWNEGSSATEGSPEVHYARSVDGGRTWSEPQVLSVRDDRRSLFPRGQFNACRGDTVAIAWRDSVEGGNWDVHMAVSLDGGRSWRAPVAVNPLRDFQSDPDLVVDPHGRLHLFFHQVSLRGNRYNDVRVVYAYSDDLGATWSDFDTVSFDRRSYLVEGSRYDPEREVLWTFWKEEDRYARKGGDILAAYSTDRGEHWSTPEYVTDRGDTSVGYKSACLLPGGGVAVNYELPNYPSSGLLRVFYKERVPLATRLSHRSLQQRARITLHPDQHFVSIQLDRHFTGRIALYRIDGLLVDSKRIVRPARGIDFDVHALPPGLYIVQVSTERGSTFGTLLKI